jgi:hypothetical protein
MLAHALHPREFLRVVHAHLKPGGHLYLYNEPDDAEYLDLKQSMFNVLNPFHMQAFDRASLVRALASNGFRSSYISHAGHNFFVLAERVDEVTPVPMADDERRQRAAAYARARDHSILRLEETQRGRFSAEWNAVVERAVVDGIADMDDAGRVRLKKNLEPSVDTAYHA